MGNISLMHSSAKLTTWYGQRVRDRIVFLHTGFFRFDYKPLRRRAGSLEHCLRDHGTPFTGISIFKTCAIVARAENFWTCLYRFRIVNSSLFFIEWGLSPSCLEKKLNSCMLLHMIFFIYFQDRLRLTRKVLFCCLL